MARRKRPKSNENPRKVRGKRRSVATPALREIPRVLPWIPQHWSQHFSAGQIAEITTALHVEGPAAASALGEITYHAVTYRALDAEGDPKEDFDARGRQMPIPPPRSVSAGPEGVVIKYKRPVGRPSLERLGILVNLLALTWERYHGKFPGRSRKRRDESKDISSVDDGPFVRFVRACLAAIDPKKDYPSALVRRVIRGRKLLLTSSRGPIPPRT